MDTSIIFNAYEVSHSLRILVKTSETDVIMILLANLLKDS